jgi:hypothetical protein
MLTPDKLILLFVKHKSHCDRPLPTPSLMPFCLKVVAPVGPAA